MSGDQLEVILGHFTFAFFLRRCCLSVFRSRYTFASRFKKRVGRLWNSALVELRVASALLILVDADFKLPWSPVVTVADAAPHGFAVHEGLWSPEEVVAVGAHSEKWRFKRSEHPSLGSPLFEGGRLLPSRTRLARPKIERFPRTSPRFPRLCFGALGRKSLQKSTAGMSPYTSMKLVVLSGRFGVCPSGG